MIPTWFLYLGGFSLILLGLMQIQARPKQKETALQRWLSIGMLWSLICIATGCALVLMGLGYIDQPFGQPLPPRVK